MILKSWFELLFTVQTLPVYDGVVKVLFVVSRLQIITLNHTNDSDAFLCLVCEEHIHPS